MTEPSHAAPLLEMRGISKSFPGVRALDQVDFTVGEGEIHAFLGENGAGKSTLLKILSGAQPPDSGMIVFAGRPVQFASPQEAQRAGIVTIYQEFTLAPDMTVAENVFIGREPGSRLFISYRQLEEETAKLCRRIGLERSPRALVRDLSVAEQQMVEIARALSMKSRLIVMDEPTSALSRAEVEKLFAIIRNLKAEGITTIFVTHRLEEVFELCDSFTVLRDGRHVGRGKVAETDMDGIIRLMVGRELGLLAARQVSFDTGEKALEVRALNRRRKSSDASAIELHDVSLSVNRGEILGIAGLVGAGRSETARAIFGADRFDSGAVMIGGQEVRIASPRDAIAQGIGLVPEDRKQQALFLSQAIRTNMSITAQGRISRFAVFISGAKEDELVEEYRKLLNIRMASAGQVVGNLSGGNQQKVVLARWLALRPKVLIVDEPTRGIDVGAKAEVHNLLSEMAQSGIAIIVISSELPEVLALADRIVTMREGRVTGEMMRADATQEKLMTLMTVGSRQAA
ncbi:MAG: sugar ABC transporter ATP-binding protein [Aestuariivirga sp.]|uniref:sugar ABC transporter ATP-binding protein n=1 Tax=Aestuariivirga sp. TaxID=2650926 RepID=UPI0025BE2AFC|nr:sugar ABC transporter ATP-binding protein [Aestuariivirga sp.]MCA3560278.1 sugar ABC transporter ATP-binding protein [Aestuariivirga sp.]